ncbi:MAG: hypothetical protein KO464_02600 [Candidatus Methanofastidiosum sp.]|nr:hypothetical protein [Methanofastidiosum sp.]
MSFLDLDLFVLMIKEELRLHKSFVGAVGSIFFPVIIFVLSFILSLSSPVIINSMGLYKAILFLNLGAFFYGFVVGFLGKIGEEVMTRRFGEINLILQLPKLFPISLRKVMSYFFLKDAVFYLFYSIIPFTLGALVSIPISGFSLSFVVLIFIILTITFMLGMSLSFLSSSISIISSKLLVVFILGILGVLSLRFILDDFLIERIIFPIGYLENGGVSSFFIPVILAFLFSILAILSMKERFEEKTNKYQEEISSAESRFAFTGSMKTLLAKEFLELKRSGGFGPVIMGFIGPLLGIYFIVSLFEISLGVEIDYNAIFYGSMVGFFGVMTYSWLNNFETNEFLNYQPISVDMAIKAKLLFYFLLTVGLSLVYVIGISIIRNEIDLLPLALTVALVTNIYVVGVTARLTGLKTNTMLFDAKVLSKFFALVTPPLIVMVIVSFSIKFNYSISLVTLIVTLTILLFFSKIIFSTIPKRWRDERFGM